MAVYLSPGVFVNEIDASAFASAGSGIIPAFVGTAQKGPMNDPQLITSAEQFIDTFGEPFSDSYLGYAVLSFLEEGNFCWVVRVGVECEEGQPSALADVCIDVSGAKEEGWSRLPLFSGVGFGQICTREISSDDPLSFHPASTTTPEFSDVDVSGSDGETDASLALSGSYSDPTDDAFLVVITSAPTSGVLEGAGYEITRQSDGELISSGTLTDSGSGVSDSFNIGSGSDDTGLDGVITITGSSPLEAGDFFVFSAEPDNRTFSFSVEGGSALQFSFGTITYTDAETFADDFNSMAGSSEDYIAVAQSDGSVCIRTDVAGRWIQLTSTEAFALEIGQQLWAYDIPRSFIRALDTGPYNINSNNNRVVIEVVGQLETVTAQATISTSSTHDPDSIASELDSVGVIDGEEKFEAIELRISDNDTIPVVLTTLNNPTDNLRMLANTSNIKTLRFAQELNIQSPYGTDYTTFSDSRVVLPAQGTVDAAVPASCEADPLSDDCAADTAYYDSIVGFLVMESPGTWANNYSVGLEIFDNQPGRYTLRVFDDQGIVVTRHDDVSFDPTEDRYIGNIINEGSSIGGANGDEFIRWEPRPLDLANDPDDESTFEVRNPGTFSRQFVSDGTNGIPTDPAYSSELDAAILGNEAESTGIFHFQNEEAFEIDLLITPGVSTGAVIGQAIQLCESRGDCVYIVDPPFGLRPQQVIDWHNGMLDSTLTTALNSSYAALYWSWQKKFDQFAREEIFIPPSGSVSSVFARTERVGEQWFAPAGLNRGRLPTSLDVEYNPSRPERDTLYGLNNAVNPIVKFPQDGIVVWGQRTLQRADTALDRVNVRMLLSYLRRNLISLLRNFIMEPNDRFLRRSVQRRVEPVLRDVASRRGVTGFKVVCDETNNTPIRINRNELWVTVFIQPTKAAEFIVLNLVVLRTDESFSAEEVLIAGGISLQQ